MKSITFDNGRGFALGFDEAAPSPFVTWQFTETENGQKDYYWGHYHSSGQTAEKDFAKRVADYKELFGVHERTDGHEQAEYPGLTIDNIVLRGYQWYNILVGW